MSTLPAFAGRAIRWPVVSYPLAVARRFFTLELLERSFGLAAQAFVALLPLVIAVVSAFTQDSGTLIADQITTRFGLDVVAHRALQALFTSTSDVVTISWLALAMSLLSAFALSRRLARTYAAIFEVPSLRRNQTWRGLVWILLQVTLLIAASTLRDVNRTHGGIVEMIAIMTLFAVWFGADWFGLRLLVPSAENRLVVASAIVSSIGRLAISTWAAIYMPAAMSNQAAQYGPIGVTFTIFTYILVNVVLYVGAPLLVTTWLTWRAERAAGEQLVLPE
jgi:membrane protein